MNDIKGSLRDYPPLIYDLYDVGSLIHLDDPVLAGGIENTLR